MSDNQNAQTILSLESLINSFDSRLESLTKEARTHKEMLQSLLDGNAEYVTANDASTKASKLTQIAKQKALKVPEAVTLIDKIKDYQSQIKEVKVGLSDYLSQYVTLSGTTQIDSPDGTTKQIVYSAKLVKKKG
ncbi:MAG: hypothetical protein WCV93_04425 [Candidatus Shapirobacteria bacterium]|jgi:5'-3' exonuclease